MYYRNRNIYKNKEIDRFTERKRKGGEESINMYIYVCVRVCVSLKKGKEKVKIVQMLVMDRERERAYKI